MLPFVNHHGLAEAAIAALADLAAGTPADTTWLEELEAAGLLIITDPSEAFTCLQEGRFRITACGWEAIAQRRQAGAWLWVAPAPEWRSSTTTCQEHHHDR